MYVIHGGNTIEGKVRVQGAKNTVLPILAAALLLSEPVTLKGCPRISDVYTMLALIEQLGGAWSWRGEILTVDGTGIKNWEVDGLLAQECRASILFMGALLGREKKVRIHSPGGCAIGKRPINIHVEGMKQLGAKVREEEDFIHVSGERMQSGTFHMKFPSVGATQNLILSCVKLPGITKLYNGAREPEVVYLCDFLRKCGAKIQGERTDCIVIQGVKRLKGVSYEIPGDRIVGGTYLTMAAASGGSAQIEHVQLWEIESLLFLLERMGCSIYRNQKSVILYRNPKNRLKSVEQLYTQPFPGFPTDMQSQWMVAAAVARGKSKVCEKIFENRFQIVDPLKQMGANIHVEQDTAFIEGVESLSGCEVWGKDLRGACALMVAGAVAKGTTLVHGQKYIDRGHEDIVRDFKLLGVKVKQTK